MRPLLEDLQEEMHKALALWEAARFSIAHSYFEDEFARRYPLPSMVDADASRLQSVTYSLWTPVSGHFSFHVPFCVTPVSLLSQFGETLVCFRAFCVHAERVLALAGAPPDPLQAFPFLMLVRKWSGVLLLNASVLKKMGARYMLEAEGGDTAAPADGAVREAGVIDSAFVLAHLPALDMHGCEEPREVLRALPSSAPWVFVLPRPNWLMREMLATYDAFMCYLAQEPQLQRLAFENHLQQRWVGRDGALLKEHGSAAAAG